MVLYLLSYHDFTHEQDSNLHLPQSLITRVKGSKQTTGSKYRIAYGTWLLFSFKKQGNRQ